MSAYVSDLSLQAAFTQALTTSSGPPPSLIALPLFTQSLGNPARFPPSLEFQATAVALSCSSIILLFFLVAAVVVKNI